MSTLRLSQVKAQRLGGRYEAIVRRGMTAYIMRGFLICLVFMSACLLTGIYVVEGTAHTLFERHLLLACFVTWILLSSVLIPFLMYRKIRAAVAPQA
jgi:hypothetical protein